MITNLYEDKIYECPETGLYVSKKDCTECTEPCEDEIKERQQVANSDG